MKKIWFSLAVAAVLALPACDKSNGVLTPEEQKSEIEKISDEFNSIVKADAVKDAKSVADYYNNTLADYNTMAIKTRCGNVLGLTDNLFAALPSTKSASVDTKAIEWSLTVKNAEFQANASSKKWEYVGEGSGDGIYLNFKDGNGRDCHLRIVAKNELTGLLSGRREAAVELFLGEELIANCDAVCVSNGLTDLTSSITASYGPVKSVTELTSLHGEYAVSERVTYDGRNLVNCTVTAGGVTYASDIVSSFKHVTATIDVMDNLQVVVNCEASIPDMFLTDWTKDYVTKLQEYIDKNVDVKVYLTHSSDAPQAEIRLRVEKTGAPLFGKIQVVPYIYFAADDTTCELDAYFQSASALPDVIRCLEDLLGNIRIEY